MADIRLTNGGVANAQVGQADGSVAEEPAEVSEDPAEAGFESTPGDGFLVAASPASEATEPYLPNPLLAKPTPDQIFLERFGGFENFFLRWIVPDVLSPSQAQRHVLQEWPLSERDVFHLVSHYWAEKFNTLSFFDYEHTGEWSLEQMQRSESIAYTLIRTRKYLNVDDGYKPVVLVLGPGTNLIEVEFWLKMGAKVIAVEAEKSTNRILKVKIQDENFTLLEELPPPDLKADIIIATHPDTNVMAYLKPGRLKQVLGNLDRRGFFLIQTDDHGMFPEIFKNPSMKEIFTQPVGHSSFFMPSGYLIISISLFSILVRR